MTTKVGIVTGGGQGIGKAIARSLLQEGYKVGILDIDEAVGKETAEGFSSEFGSGSCVFFRCDVTETEQLKGSYEQVKKLLGNVTVVVNNAGIAQEVNWTKCIDINLKALIDMTYIAVDNMRKDKGGNGGIIVNVASMSGMGSFPGFPTYAATKWGVIGFTKSMAASLALAEVDWGINLQSLCPLWTDTKLMQDAGMDARKRMIVSPATPGEECKKYVHDRVLQSHIMSPSDIGKAFTKLLKDNKRDAVLMVRPGEDSTVQKTYVEQKWSEI